MSFVNASVLWLLLPLGIYLFRGAKRRLSQYLRWVVLALLIVALARPVISEMKKSQDVEAQSLTIALDLSY